MTSRRITKDLRNSITSNLLRSTYAPRIKKAQDELRDYGVELVKRYRDSDLEAAYITVFNNENGTTWDKYNGGHYNRRYHSLNQASFSPDTGDKNENARSVDFLQVLLFRETHTTIQAKDNPHDHYQLKIREKETTSPFISMGSRERYFIKKQEWTKLNRLQNEYEELIAAAAEAVTAANVVMHSVTTVKRLLEVWPELDPFIPSLIQGKNLPDITKAELNAHFGLPSETKLGKRPEAS